MSQTLTAFSKRNPATGADMIGNCTLVMGDGTFKVPFENGRAEVPVELADMLLLDGRVEIPGYKDGTTVAREPEPEPEAYEDMTVKQLRELVAEREIEVSGKATKAKLIAALEDADETADVNEQQQVDIGGGVTVTHTSGLQVADVNSSGGTEADLTIVEGGGEELSDAAKAAAEHLAEEGEDVPATVPEGFEQFTADGQVRCTAEKKDGSQCSNAATDGGRCNLPQHRP